MMEFPLLHTRINENSAVLQKEIEMLHIENERLHKEIDWLRSLVEQKLK